MIDRRNRLLCLLRQVEEEREIAFRIVKVLDGIKSESELRGTLLHFVQKVDECDRTAIELRGEIYGGS
ncbi:MAG TPA: hypothetical protein DDW52_14930 [Planctomycetaceae bacterium]|nr:hypothetical protein [Planctomycetaceae bacterium]